MAIVGGISVDLKEIKRVIKEEIPQVERIEAEGPLIVVYVPDVSKVGSRVLSALAQRIKKRVSLRSVQKKSPEETKKFIIKAIPKEVGLKDIFFIPDFDEVVLEVKDPGVLVGKYPNVLTEIFEKTGWRPRVERLPALPSTIIYGIRRIYSKVSAQRKKFLINLGKRINVNSKVHWARAVALGGFKEVGRSSLMVETNNARVLIDCGVNNALTDPLRAYPMLNAERLSPENIDAIVISHAHLDHCGFLPYLFSLGYDGPVFVTPPTRDLMVLIQQDYLNVLEKNGVENLPYSVEDIQKQLKAVITVGYHEVIDITSDMKLSFYNAGHILGSAMVHLNIGNGFHNVLYTGDIKYGFARLFDEAETRFNRVETMFIESTYGGNGDFQPPREESEARLIRIIEETTEKNGTVLIPSFSIGRAQEIMLTLYNHYRDDGAPFPIYTDGMILEVSAIHSAYPEYLKASLREEIMQGNNPFKWKHFKNARGISKAQVTSEPSVVIAPSGMLQGGPSYEYLKILAEDERNTLIFVGYQAPGTLGAKIKNGEKEISLKENGRIKVLRVNMRVETVEGFSGHSDRRQLIGFVRNMRPKPRRVITMHGESPKPEQLAFAIRRLLRRDSRAIANLEGIRLR